MEKKYDKDESLAKIKARISLFYENIGREIIEDSDAEQKQLIEDIDGILNQTEISAKHLVIEKLELDNEVKKELKGRWKA